MKNEKTEAKLRAFERQSKSFEMNLSAKLDSGVANFDFYPRITPLEI